MPAAPGQRWYTCGVKRWAFNVLNGLSLVLWVAAIGLWVRSYWVSDDVTREFATGQGYWSWSFAHVGRGRLLLVLAQDRLQRGGLCQCPGSEDLGLEDGASLR